MHTLVKKQKGFRNYRLTDNDKYFGPITYGRVDWMSIKVVLCSEDSQVANNSNLTIQLGGLVFSLHLGGLIKPVEYRVKATTWPKDYVEKVGKNWYNVYFVRRYGFSITNEVLHVMYGIDNSCGMYTHLDSEGYLCYNKQEAIRSVPNRNISFTLPWRQYRVHSATLYDADMNVYKHSNIYLGREEAIDCPKVKFLIRDFDNEVIIVTTYVKKVMYKVGRSKFSWLSYFFKDVVNYYLELEFSSGLGCGKGSYKGGTLACSTDMDNYSSHEEAFKAFCDKNHYSRDGDYKITFLRRL